MTVIRVGMMMTEYKVGDHVVVGDGNIHWVVAGFSWSESGEAVKLYLESPMSNRHRFEALSNVRPWRP